MAAVRRDAETEAGRRARALALLAERSGSEPLFRQACEAFAILLGYRWAGLLLLEEQGSLRLEAAWGASALSAPAPWPLSALSEWHQASGAEANLPGLAEAVGFPVESCRVQAIKSPGGEVIGQLWALHDESDDSEARHQDLAALLASWAAGEAERQRLQQEVAQSKDTLDILLNHMREAVMLFGPDLRVRAINRRMCEIFGYSESLFQNATLDDIIRYNVAQGEYGPGDPEALARRRHEMVIAGVPDNFEHRRPDGRVLEVQGRALPRGGYLRSMIDVTSHRRLQDALRESERRYRVVTEMTSDLVFSYLVQGDRFLPEWMAGSPFAKRLGVEPQVNLERLVYAADRPLLEACKERLLSGRGCVEELRLDLGDGVLWVHLTTQPEIDPASGRTMRVFGALKDITESKRAEVRLREAMRAVELADRTKSDFLANMSHELRTPLNAIIGFAEVMEHEMLGPLGQPVYRDYVGDIRASGLHLLEIINDILDVSKAEAGKLELDQEPVAPRELIESCLRLVRQRAEQAQVDLRVELPKRTPLLLGDPRRLKQILLNLLTNAIKFSPLGGIVRLSIRIGPRSGILIEVVDSGIGMSAEEVTRALQPFTQLHPGLHRGHEGTGLGLPLSRRLVELHDGTLTLDTTPGKGTRVRVQLPPSRIVYRRRRLKMSDAVQVREARDSDPL
ncbi:MAG TPA: ATP-binding protein [Kiloniellales bacterium]|nr:ATP-binding protein [Kiloniellales bacterium]